MNSCDDKAPDFSFSAMLHLITLAYAVFFASAQSDEFNWEDLVPDSLKTIAGTKLVEANLNYAIFRNRSGGKGEAWRETYKQISRNDTFTTENMLNFIRNYYSDMSRSTNASAPPEELMQRAADANMLMVTGSRDVQAANKAMFRNFTTRLLETEFKYSYSVCQAFSARHEVCRKMYLSRQYPEFRPGRLPNTVMQHATSAIDFCTSGITSFLRYPTETCFLSAPFDASVPVRQLVENCLASYQCFMTAEQRNSTRWNPWNLTNPFFEAIVMKQTQSDVFDLSTETPEQIGMRALVMTYIREAFDYFKDRGTLILGLGIVFLILSYLLAAQLAQLSLQLGIWQVTMWGWLAMLMSIPVYWFTAQIYVRPHARSYYLDHAVPDLK